MKLSVAFLFATTIASGYAIAIPQVRSGSSEQPCPSICIDKYISLFNDIQKKDPALWSQIEQISGPELEELRNPVSSVGSGGSLPNVPSGTIGARPDVSDESNDDTPSRGTNGSNRPNGSKAPNRPNGSDGLNAPNRPNGSDESDDTDELEVSSPIGSSGLFPEVPIANEEEINSIIESLPAESVDIEKLPSGTASISDVFKQFPQLAKYFKNNPDVNVAVDMPAALREMNDAGGNFNPGNFIKFITKHITTLTKSGSGSSNPEDENRLKKASKFLITIIERTLNASNDPDLIPEIISSIGKTNEGILGSDNIFSHLKLPGLGSIPSKLIGSVGDLGGLTGGSEGGSKGGLGGGLGGSLGSLTGGLLGGSEGGLGGVLGGKGGSGSLKSSSGGLTGGLESGSGGSMRGSGDSSLSIGGSSSGLGSK